MIGKNSNMNWIVVIISIIITLTLILLLTTTISFHIYKKEKGMSLLTISIKCFSIIFKLKTVDFGKYIKKTMLKYGLKENLLNTMSKVKLMIASNKLIQKYLKNITIDKVTLIPRYNSSNPTIYPFLIVMNWNVISVSKYLLDRYFKKVNNEYYGVMMNDDTKQGIDLEIKGSIKVIKVILVSFFNLKSIIKLMKKEKKNGRSKTNQSVVTNSNGFIKGTN